MKRVLKWLGLGVVGLLVVIVFNTIRYTPPAVPTADVPVPEIDADAVARKLSEAIQFRTISHPFGQPGRPSAYQDFIDWIPEAFPNATATMERTIVGGFTPLYRWKGSDAAQAPILISGHYDVVPIEGTWSRDPWAGDIAEGYVWGRGALDMKGGVVTLLEAIDQLAATGFQPQRDIYIALTQDEEIGGAGGAASVIAHFAENGIAIDWSLDEGSFVLRDVIGSIEEDIASINVAEKGYMTVQITARGAGGHSSLPQRETAVSKLAEAIVELQADPVPGGLTDVSASFFDSLGPHMGLAERILFANTWLFRPVLEHVLSGTNTTDAMLRTTKAPTMLEGSEAENILPQAASVFVNFRLHPRDDEASVLRHIRHQISQDHIDVDVLSVNAASAVSAHNNDAFAQLSQATRAVFGDIVVVPGLTIAGTDSGRYSTYAQNSYRFLPFVFTSDDIALLHGKDERISIDNLERAVQFYMVLMRGL